MSDKKIQELDYQKLGLVAGIEIHQQLEGKKLFCSTPTQIRDDASHFTVQRKLRAVVGETGKIDEAAAAESKKEKTYLYHGYLDTIGLVELDEEPPHAMNQDALTCATQVAKLLNCHLVDEVQVMRKTVVDGSNTSGFQRTSLLGMDGYLITSKNEKISILAVVIEEDASKKEDKLDTSGQTVYNLSRLGIPLIEISTGPDLRDPKQVQEVAEQIGMVLRSTGKVKRGLGTIRQDINVSIRGGNRVEIKGAQELKLIPQYVEYEAIRQLNILNLAEEFKQKNIGPQSLANPIDLSHLFEQTQCQLIAKSLKVQKVVLGAKLSNFHGLIGQELQPGKRIGTDLSDFAKVHAGIGGIIHSDEDLAKYQLSADEISHIKKELDVHANDAFILIVDSSQKTHAAFVSIKDRLHLLKHGVPKEVRKANPDATTTYMRPMPGASRMYPETDCVPVKVNPNVALPELLEEKIARYISQYKLPADRAKMIAKSANSNEVEEYFVKYQNIKPAVIVETIMGSGFADITKRIGKEIESDQLPFTEAFDAVNAGKLPVASLNAVLADTVITKKTVQQLIFEIKIISDDEIKAVIAQVKVEFPNAPIGLLMGKVMAKFGGKADGAKVAQLLK